MKNSLFFAVPLIASLTSVTFAGPTWDEGDGVGAGSLPPTSQPVAGSTKSAVSRVSGATSATGLVGPSDPIDMFTVSTGSDPFQFRFDMKMGAGGNPVWNARLYIFKKMTITCYTETGISFPLVVARPIAVVTKLDATRSYPFLDGSLFMANDPSKRLGDLLEANTDYFVCVTGKENEGLFNYVDGGGCPLSSPPGTAKAFQLGETTTGYGMYRPYYGSGTTIDMTAYTLASWTNPPDLSTGPYNNDTAGVFTVSASNCSSTTRSTGTSLIDFDFNFAPATAAGTTMCGEPVGRQFFYHWTSDCAGTVTVKTCALTNQDTLISVYALDPCNPVACDTVTGTAIACDDQGCGNNQSTVSFPAQIGQQFIVVLGRWQTGAPETSAIGRISFSCVSPNGSSDLNHDGIVNGQDLAILFGMWGTNGN